MSDAAYAAYVGGSKLGVPASLIAVVLAACGGDPTTPVLESMSIAPMTGIRVGDELTVTVRFTDEDGDLAGGHAEIALRLQTEASGDVARVGLGEEPGSQGTLTFEVMLPGGAVPGVYELGVTVVDSAGRRSKSLVGEFTVLE